LQADQLLGERSYPIDVTAAPPADMIGTRCTSVNPSGMTTKPPPGSRPRAMPRRSSQRQGAHKR
jgi:hypothetical protein